ncbi:alpha/beta hydrolase [Microbacterium esteraromaticum]|uniref:alpha/beta hydrolase n=1 Tax=Microbacterium esteraromaticum TaxID=57043 RepID=UPI001C96D544|nr:alpha/beta hydrolase [Microbacterium esteraromaticum]MBY6060892.1 alpha/beta hydrolase [Microbacterium esteraromaticum]
MTHHDYRTTDVPVAGGDLRVAVWEPQGEVQHTVLAIHGVTSSHLAWPFVVQQLPGVRVIAPDLRGRGASNTLPGPAGMAAHADDLAAVLDAFDVDVVSVVGHSMGAFVAVVLAHRYPQRVSRLVLVDGGLPLNVPAGVDPEQLVPLILGPVAERLSRRWPDVEAYTEEFWRRHPAFADDWSAELDAYIAYDLVPDGDVLRAATSSDIMADDVIDMNTGSALPDALAALSVPTLFITVPRGLQNETPGLYAPAHLADLLQRYPAVDHVHLDDLNHYTVVMSPRGAIALAHLVRPVLV